jgi:hypothetical protein
VHLELRWGVVSGAFCRPVPSAPIERQRGLEDVSEAMRYGKPRSAKKRSEQAPNMKIAAWNCIKLAHPARSGAGGRRVFTIVVTSG